MSTLCKALNSGGPVANALSPAEPDSSPRDADHVPEVDIMAPPFATDPAGEIDRLRARTWVVRTVRGYEVLDYEVVRQMCVDPRLDSIGADYYRNLGASELIMWWATQGSLP